MGEIPLFFWEIVGFLSHTFANRVQMCASRGAMSLMSLRTREEAILGAGTSIGFNRVGDAATSSDQGIRKPTPQASLWHNPECNGICPALVDGSFHPAMPNSYSWFHPNEHELG
jgi:hypothetical protein